MNITILDSSKINRTKLSNIAREYSDITIHEYKSLNDLLDNFVNADITFISDLLPDATTKEAITAIKSLNPIDQIIMTSNNTNAILIDDAFQLGIDHYLIKPIKKADLDDILKK